MCKDILERNLYESAFVRSDLPSDFYVLQDNAKQHTSKIVQEWMKMNDVMQIEFPPNSTDLNSIENIWGFLKKNVNNNKWYSTANDLQMAIENEWVNMRKNWTDILQNLVRSMPNRLSEVIRAKGYHTDY